MKKTALLVLLVIGTLAVQAQTTEASQYKTQNEQGMNEVYEFLKACGTYYIATIDGDQPRVRPFGTVNIFDGKLYIQSGKKKRFAQQVSANPNTEICAFNGNEWIRLSGKLIEDDRREAKKDMLDHYPSLRKMYSEDDDNTIVYYIKDAVARISSFTAPEKEITF